MKKRFTPVKATAFMLAIFSVLAVGCSKRSNSVETSQQAPTQNEPIVSSSTPENKTDPADILTFENVPEVTTDPEISLPPMSLEADFSSLANINNEMVTWGPGTQQNDKGRSIACEGLQEKYGDYGAYFIAPEEDNTITISFDQGYENGYTASILDTLKEKNVTAIFFLTGHYVRSQPELVQRMIDEGHILGNHSDSHKVYCRDITPEDSVADALWMHNYLLDNFNYEMRLFRFPEGEFSQQSLELMNQLGYKSLFWSFGYNDWDPNNQMDHDSAKERIYKYLHPGEIMLLHSVGATNEAILGDVIDEIRNRGYTIGPFEDILQ